MRRLESFDWWPQLVALKDELSLRELAERFSVTPGAISSAFKRGGLTRRPAPPGPRALRPRLGENTTGASDVLGDLGGSGPPVRPGSKDGQIGAVYHLLGTLPDADVAAKAGVSVRTIANYRARYKVPAYSGPRRVSLLGGHRVSKIDPHQELLGQVPDRVVAAKAGVSLNAVRNYRVKRGISAARRGGVASQESTAIPASVSSGNSAWRIKFGTPEGVQERVIIAATVVDAAVDATEAALGEVLEVTWVASVL